MTGFCHIAETHCEDIGRRCPSCTGRTGEALSPCPPCCPFNREQLEHKRRDLLATWHPHRYANLTNNPKRYMQMYKKGESMTKEIQKAV